MRVGKCRVSVLYSNDWILHRSPQGILKDCIGPVRFLFSNHASDNSVGKNLSWITRIGGEQLKIYYSNLSYSGGLLNFYKDWGRCNIFWLSPESENVKPVSTLALGMKVRQGSKYQSAHGLFLLTCLGAFLAIQTVSW